MLKSFRRWAARLIAPIAIIGAVAVPAIVASPAAALTGSYVLDCGNIPWTNFSPTECGNTKMVNINNVIQYAEAKGTHSWTNFQWAFYAYDNMGVPIGNGYGPWVGSGTSWHVAPTPAGTHQVEVYIWNINANQYTDHFYGAIAW